MVYTCSCCRYIEYRDFAGCGNYYCTLHKDYMYGGSRQYDQFQLDNEVVNMDNDDVRKRLDEIVKNLMKSIIPKQINGRDLFGGYSVNICTDSYGITPVRTGFTQMV